MVVFLTERKEMNVKIGRVLGTAQFYSQNGSVRIALTKKVARKLHIERFGNDNDKRDSDDEDDTPSFVLLETSIGITICPLGIYTNDVSRREKTRDRMVVNGNKEIAETSPIAVMEQ